jgi:hypothetical protein
LEINKTIWSVNLKNFAMVFFLVAILGFLFNGYGRKTNAATRAAIAADSDSGCISVDGNARYIGQQKCRQGADCHINSQ